MSDNWNGGMQVHAGLGGAVRYDTTYLLAYLYEHVRSTCFDGAAGRHIV